VDLSIELQILAFHEQRKTANLASPGALRGPRAVRRLREDPVNPGEFEDEGTPAAAAHYADPAAETEPLPRYGYDEVRPA
jgi:hypothetical protein